MDSLNILKDYYSEDMFRRIGHNRVVRSVECNREDENQSRTISNHVYPISQLCRDIKISRTDFDYEMRKFRERWLG